MTVGFGWVFAHAYEGQPFTEAVIPVGICTGIFGVVGIIVGLLIWRWERKL